MRFFWNFRESNTEITFSRIDFKIVARFEDISSELGRQHSYEDQCFERSSCAARHFESWQASMICISPNINAIERSEIAAGFLDWKHFRVKFGSTYDIGMEL